MVKGFKMEIGDVKSLLWTIHNPPGLQMELLKNSGPKDFWG